MKTLLSLAVVFPLLAQDAAPVPPAGEKLTKLPPGRHVLLERFTEEFGLSYDQQLQIEPLLHNEESVSKPLLAFSAFSPEEKQAVMAKIKLAARRQIRTLLTPEQQKKMDLEIESVSKTGGKGSGAKSGSKKAAPKVDPFDNEEALSQAILRYGALTSDEQRAMVLQVKQAALRDNGLDLTPEQRTKLDADIQQLSQR